MSLAPTGGRGVVVDSRPDQRMGKLDIAGGDRQQPPFLGSSEVPLGHTAPTGSLHQYGEITCVVNCGEQ
jgi:hypothetical protein